MLLKLYSVHLEKLYKNVDFVEERHRHRYEFNNDYLKDFEAAGMIATGINPKTNLVEILELPSHPWFVGVQFHPELKSTVENPHPLFVDFVKACRKLKFEQIENRAKEKV